MIGVDFTPEMVAKARENAGRLGFQNVEFRQGDIEEPPVSDGMIDVVVSNCVLNLVPDKRKAFSEVMRVLARGAFQHQRCGARGRTAGPSVKRRRCTPAVSGALQESEYLGIIHELGFEQVTVQKRKAIVVPDDILQLPGPGGYGAIPCQWHRHLQHHRLRLEVSGTHTAR